MNIEHGICAFMQRVIDSEKPALIVPVERKGTAILRALIDSVEDAPLKWPWTQIISSAVLSTVGEERLAGRRILVFDELARHGRHLRDAIDQLLASKVNRKDIITAVFAAHEDCTQHLDHFCHSQLDDELYERYRNEMVEMLQRRGSLLLDTEHIEILVRIETSVKDFADMLSVCGEGVAVFRSGSDRLNITLDSPYLSDRESLEQFLPAGCDVEGVVNKCRVVMTNNPSEFALIPIFYADTPAQPSSDWYAKLPSFIKAEQSSPKGVFYTVGLLTALQVLRSVVSMLRGFDGLIIDCPCYVSDEDETPGRRGVVSLNHTLAMYPHVKGDSLQEYVSEILHSAAPTRTKRPHSSNSNVSESVLDEYARKLGALIVTKTDERLSRHMEVRNLPKAYPLGLPNRSVFMLAERNLKVKRAHASAAIDRLIDEAYLVTKVEPVRGIGKSALWGRTFEPDGELASARIRRFAALDGSIDGALEDV